MHATCYDFMWISYTLKKNKCNVDKQFTQTDSSTMKIRIK